MVVSTTTSPPASIPITPSTTGSTTPAISTTTTVEMLYLGVGLGKSMVAGHDFFFNTKEKEKETHPSIGEV